MINGNEIFTIQSDEEIRNIIHLSDIHIRTGNNNQSRYNEYMNVFKNLIISLKKIEDIQNGKSIIIITGDIFHHKSQIESPGIDLFSYLTKELTNLAPVYIIMGNHDYRQDNIDDSDLLSALIKNSNYSNLHYLDKTGFYIINNILLGLVAINDVLLSGDTSGMVDNLPNFPNPLDIDLSQYNISHKIALYHGIIIDENNHFFKDQNKGIESKWFKNYDFAILGDNHTQQVNNINNNKEDRTFSKNINKLDISLSNKINENDAIWGYSGSLIQQNFSETISNHGYLLWDLDNYKVESYDVENNKSFCTFNFKEDNKNKNKDWFKSSVEFNDYLNKNLFLKNVNIRFLSNEKNVNISDIIDVLDKKKIVYNKFYYNNDLLKKDNVNSTVENVNAISSYNSPESWYEFIDSNVDSEIIGNYNWKKMLNNPEILQINEENIPEILKKKVEDKNKKLLNQLTKYINSIESHNNVKNILKLQYIEWNWMLCYKDNCWFNFDNMDSNVALLNARNGYGKSSFLEIICLALFGESIPSRYNKQLSASVICQQKPKDTPSKSSIKLIFKLDNEEYMITRSFFFQNTDITKLSMKEVELYNVNDDNLVKLKSGSKGVKEWMTTHIGSIDSFLLSSMLTQNSDKDFFSMKYNDQVNLLDKALSLDAINVLVELLRQTKLAYSNIIDALDVQYMEISSSQIECITDNEVDEYKKLMNNTKEDLEQIQNSLYDKLSKINQYINISQKNEKDINLDISLNDSIINEKIEKIEKLLYDKNSININKLYNICGGLNSNIDNIVEILKDLKINYDEYNIDNNDGNCNSGNILWNIFHKNSTRYNNRYENNEEFEHYSRKNVKDIEEEYNNCIEYFKNIESNNITLEELECINIKLLENLEEINDDLNKQIIKIDNNNKLKNKYNTEINKLLKLQKNLENIDTTITECNKSLEQFENMKEKIKKKKNLLKNNEELLILLDKNYIEFIKINNELEELKYLIKDINTKEYPFNPECKCCALQPWKLHLLDLENQVKIKDKSLEKINKIFKNNNVKLIDFNDFKKQLHKNIDKFTKYIEKYNEYENKIVYWNNQINTINQYKGYDKQIKILEDNGILNNRELKENEVNKKMLIVTYNKIKVNITNNENNLSLKKDYNIWIEKKNQTDKDIIWYYIYSKKKCKEYSELLCKKKDITEKIDKYNKNLENIENIKYWKNILIVKPLWKEYIDLKHSVTTKTNYLNIVSNKYSILKKENITYKNSIEKKTSIENVLNDFKNLSNIFDHFSEIFGNFRNWLYKNKIIPLIILNTNDIISKISNNDKEILSIDVLWNDKGTFNWILKDGNNKPTIEKASGFQRFIIGLSIKITLSNIGVSNLQCKHLFIDEGFTSCDKEHLNKVPLFINSLLTLYDSILVVSHLQQIKDSVSITMNINRDIEKSLSYINYGNKINITSSKLLKN